MDLLYHESQEAALCGVHCLNTLLQGPYFSELDLGQISQELDAKEREMMAAGGTEGEEYKRFLAEGSHNAAADGMFSIQVLETALKIWGLTCISVESPAAGLAAQQPEKEEAFILNLQEHWFTIRQACGSWWNFNSLSAAPEPLSPFYLSAYLATMREQGYQIFVIRGALPRPTSSASSQEGGRWFTPQQAREASSEAANTRQTGYAKALLANLADKSSTKGTFVQLKPRLGGDEDADLARAIAASLNEATGAPSAAACNGSIVDNEDDELAKAIAASLEGTSQAPEPVQRTYADPGPEPAAGPGVLDIAFRFPDGNRKIRRFRKSDPVASLINFIGWNGVDTTGYVLSRQFPRQVLRDGNLSLAAAQLNNMETLAIERGS